MQQLHLLLLIKFKSFLSLLCINTYYKSLVLHLEQVLATLLLSRKGKRKAGNLVHPLSCFLYHAEVVVNMILNNKFYYYFCSNIINDYNTINFLPSDCRYRYCYWRRRNTEMDVRIYFPSSDMSSAISIHYPSYIQSLSSMVTHSNPTEIAKQFASIKLAVCVKRAGASSLSSL